MNRREFLVGGGSVLAAGCAIGGVKPSAGKPSAVRPSGEWALAPRNKLRLSCPGVASPFTVWVAGDTHLGEHDARDDEHADYYKRMAQWPGSTQAFEKMLADAKAAKVDLVLLVGDQISFPTLANVEFVKGALDRGDVPWLYISGNHDWHFEGVPGSDHDQRERWIPKRLSSLYPKGANPLCYSKVVKGVRFVMMDDSDYLITPEQLAFWKAEIAKGDPTVLSMHIPIWTDGWDNRDTLASPDWGAAIDRYWEIERRQRWPEKATPETYAFVDSVLSAPNLVAVFTGHIHAFMAARCRGKNMFSVPQNRKGDRLEVTFVPEA